MGMQILRNTTRIQTLLLGATNLSALAISAEKIPCPFQL